MSPGDIVICTVCPTTCRCIARLILQIHGTTNWSMDVLCQTQKNPKIPYIKRELCYANEVLVRLATPEELLLI